MIDWNRVIPREYRAQQRVRARCYIAQERAETAADNELSDEMRTFLKACYDRHEARLRREEMADSPDPGDRAIAEAERIADIAYMNAGMPGFPDPPGSGIAPADLDFD